jgi:hypothetical protein
MKKKIYLFIGFGVLLILATSLSIYWYYFSKPEMFLSNEQIIKEINHFLPEAPANNIQETVQIDARHYFVPFITKEKEYGMSYWEWKKHKWKMLHVENGGEPRLWKIDPNDPTAFYIVWNMKPSDKVSDIDFYLSHDRDYSIINGTEHYYSPKIQMKKRISTSRKSYGVMELPNTWRTVINSIVKSGTEGQANLFNDFNLNQQIYFGWIPYDRWGKEATPEGSLNGYGYTNDDINLEFIRYINKSELESQ